MKDPNINIKRSDLKKVFKELGIPSKDMTRFIEACSKHRVINRVSLTAKATVRKKVARAVKVIPSNTTMFKKLLMAVRTSENHNLSFIKHIQKGSRDYTNLSEAAVIATEYAESYGMGKYAGMEEFIKIGIRLMRKKFALNRFKSLAGAIYEEKRIMNVLNKDNIVNAATVAKVYFRQLEEETKQKYEGDIPDSTFVNFYYAYEEIQEAKASIEDWIMAQFAGLAFMDVLPEINQIHGEGAAKRYFTYKFSRPVKKGTKVENEIDVSMMSKGQLEYFRNLKNG